MSLSNSYFYRKARQQTKIFLITVFSRIVSAETIQGRKLFAEIRYQVSLVFQQFAMIMR